MKLLLTTEQNIDWNLEFVKGLNYFPKKLMRALHEFLYCNGGEQIEEENFGAVRNARIRVIGNLRIVW